MGVGTTRIDPCGKDGGRTVALVDSVVVVVVVAWAMLEGSGCLLMLAFAMADCTFMRLWLCAIIRWMAAGSFGLRWRGREGRRR